jgi:hypothetical protein
LYRFLAEVPVMQEYTNKEDIRKLEKSALVFLQNAGLSDFVIYIARFNFGMGTQNPLNKVLFYHKPDDKPNYLGASLISGCILTMLYRAYR